VHAAYGVWSFEKDLCRPQVIVEVIAKRLQGRRQPPIEDRHSLLILEPIEGVRRLYSFNSLP